MADGQRYVIRRLL